MIYVKCSNPACSDRDALHPLSHNYCGECGQPLPEPNVICQCPHCSSLAPLAPFCGECGTRLIDQSDRLVVPSGAPAVQTG